MYAEHIIPVIEGVALGLEWVGVGLIPLAFAHAMLRGLREKLQGREDSYPRLKKYMGYALLLGLEFLVAADIIRTVTVEATVENLRPLGVLVFLRIVLGWSIAIEIDGCWPWKLSEKKD